MLGLHPRPGTPDVSEKGGERAGAPTSGTSTQPEGSEHQPEQEMDQLGPFYTCQDRSKGKAG